MKYQLFDPLTDEEYADLKADIAARGVMVPVEVDENGDVLDGHHRVMACEELGIAEYPTIVREGMTEAEKRHHVRKLNLARRHLTKEQRDAQILAMRQEGQTYREIAETVGVSKRDISQALRGAGTNGTTLPATIIGADGKSYPATRENGNGHHELAEYEREYNRPVYDEGEGDTSWLDDDEYGPPIRDDRVTRTLTMSESNEWYTPQEYVEAARRVMGGIDTDPASNDTAQGWIQADTYYTKDDDGLAQEWQGRVWLNPPYGGLSGRFVAKLFDEIAAGRVTEAVVLVNANSTETNWFAPLWHHTLCFTDHRINFYSPARSTNGSTHGSVFIYIGPNDRAFYREFAGYGYVVRMVQYDD